MGPIHLRDHGPGCFGADPEPVATRGGSILSPFRNVIGGREPALPSEHLEASGRNKILSCTTYLIPL